MANFTDFKKIELHGITYIEPLFGSSEWYWGSDDPSGDLYEAEELFRMNLPFQENRILFDHYPDGKVVEPVRALEGQYLGKPIFYDHAIYMLLVDFKHGKIEILKVDREGQSVIPFATLPYSNVQDCYNLLLKTAPLMLTRQANDNELQILWPETRTYDILDSEGFDFREGDKLYCSAWVESPDYQNEVIVRCVHTGEILDRYFGNLVVMPDGQRWIIA